VVQGGAGGVAFETYIASLDNIFRFTASHLLEGCALLDEILMSAEATTFVWSDQLETVAGCGDENVVG